MPPGGDPGKIKSGSTALLQELFLQALFSHLHRNHLALFIHAHKNLMDDNMKANVSKHNTYSEQ